MDIQKLQILAGSFSSLIFMCGTLSMLLKTWQTHNVDSFSMASLLLNNLGNLIYWMYVLSLPFGPIYFLHGFYTLATILMMSWYFLYRHHPQITETLAQGITRISDTMEMPFIGMRQVKEMKQIHESDM